MRCLSNITTGIALIFVLIELFVNFHVEIPTSEKRQWHIDHHALLTPLALSCDPEDDPDGKMWGHYFAQAGQ